MGTDQYTRAEILSFLSGKFQVDACDWVYTQRFVRSEVENALIKDVSKYAKESMRYFIKNIRNGSFVLASLKPGEKA